MTSTDTPISSSSISSLQVTLMGMNNNTQLQSLIAINSTQVPIKLTNRGNYASWRSQFENLFFRYGLMEFLDGTKPCPPVSISATTNTTDQPSAGTSEIATNPDYHLWLCQDRLLLHAIQKLEATYANRSNTRKLGLLDSLTNISLADKSIVDFMQGIKNILDNLELIGHLADDGATVIHTLNGMGSTYLPLASAIRARDTSITFEELYDKLLDYEAYLHRDKTKRGGPIITAQFN
ncbi:hypothetical protein Ddye_009019 [Dipteronia dyeriana]|uniref:Retrotransposon Copia-like N-terminal domain-containing protein n=1 Tax=Dipteronia dyeriana TaxID=168575 RepID=A0AAD9XAZ0_9ROSI|nr:hypothetical protein Ddye_009019 [Dipteronia dyeriana]